VGVCRGCGAYTQPRNGKGDAYRYCKRCHPGAIQPQWTRELVVSAMLDWRERYGRLPSSYDWSRAHAQRRGGDFLLGGDDVLVHPADGAVHHEQPGVLQPRLGGDGVHVNVLPRRTHLTAIQPEGRGSTVSMLALRGCPSMS